MNRIINYELIRARSLKSTWIFPLIGVGLAWSLAYFGTSNDGISSVTDGFGPSYFSLPDIINNSYSPLSIFFITIPFAQAFGHEYRDGTMRLTLSAYPSRIKVFTAKLLVPSAIALISGLIAMIGIRIIYQRRVPLGNTELGNLTSLRHLGFTVMWGLIVAAVVIFTRNMAAGIAGVVVWAAILEQIVVAFTVSKWHAVDQYLPLSQGMLWTQQGERKSLIVILVATTLFALLSGTKFLKSDA